MTCQDGDYRAGGSVWKGYREETRICRGPTETAVENDMALALEVFAQDLDPCRREGRRQALDAYGSLCAVEGEGDLSPEKMVDESATETDSQGKEMACGGGVATIVEKETEVLSPRDRVSELEAMGAALIASALGRTSEIDGA